MSILTTAGRAIALASALLGGTYAAVAADLKIGPNGTPLSISVSTVLAGKVPDAFKGGTLKRFRYSAAGT